MMQAAVPNGTAVSPLDLRQVCARFATDVAIVTTRDAGGVRGITADSFASVSSEPPLVVVSVENDRRPRSLLAERGRFVVNVLGRAARARRPGGRLDDADHHLLGGLPALNSAQVALLCRVVDARPAGDHTLVIGQVEQIERGVRAAAADFLPDDHTWALDACD